MKSLMISSIIRNQNEIESETTTLLRIEQVSKTTTSSKTQNAQIIKTLSKCDFISIENLNANVQSNEYERLLTTKKKIEQIKKNSIFSWAKRSRIINYLHFVTSFKEHKENSIWINLDKCSRRNHETKKIFENYQIEHL
jgi:ribosome maturation protein Sdo1